MNHCTIARSNTDNPKWSKEYLDACYTAFVDGYAQDIAAMSTLESRRRALDGLPDKFREQVKARVEELWQQRIAETHRTAQKGG